MDNRNLQHNLDSLYAAGARKNLEKYGVGINDAENGVFLAIEEGKGTSNHTTLHTANYYRNVENMLKNATSKQEVINILDTIRQQLINGTFPH